MTEETIYESLVLILTTLPARTRAEGSQTAVFYDDDKMHICRRVPEQSYEIVLHHPREGAVTVYKTRVSDEGRDVDVLRVGFWIGHLKQLRARAEEINAQRQYNRDAPPQDLGSIDDSALFPEYRSPVARPVVPRREPPAPAT